MAGRRKAKTDDGTPAPSATGTVLAGDRADPEIKAAALEAILISAVRLNRFAAMDTFNSLLPTVKADDEAAAVHDMLERRRHEYKGICHAVPRLKLHPTIRRLRDELCPLPE